MRTDCWKDPLTPTVARKIQCYIEHAAALKHSDLNLPTYAAQRCTTPTLAELAMSPFADDITGDEAVDGLTDQLSGLQLIARRLDQLPPLPPQPSPLPPTPPPRASSAPPPVSPPTAPSSCESSPIFARHASVVDLRRLYANNGLKDRVVLLMGHELLMDELKTSDCKDADILFDAVEHRHAVEDRHSLTPSSVLVLARMPQTPCLPMMSLEALQ